jgi:hypothetical protein
MLDKIFSWVKEKLGTRKEDHVEPALHVEEVSHQKKKKKNKKRGRKKS